jgi:hypothetical protein
VLSGKGRREHQAGISTDKDMGKRTEKKGKKIAKRYYDRASARDQERGLSISEFGQQNWAVQSREIGGSSPSAQLATQHVVDPQPPEFEPSIRLCESLETHRKTTKNDSA